MTLDSFLNSLPTSWEEDRNISIVETVASDEQLRIELLVIAHDYGNTESVSKQLVVTVQKPVAVNLDFVSTHYIGIEEGHPLSWLHYDTSVELYFSGILSEPSKAVLELCDVHHSTFEGYLPLDRFLNFRGNISNWLSNTSGLVARGPRKLLIQFDRVLKSRGATTSIIGDSKRENDGDFPVLFLGNGFIVGQSFEFIVTDC